MSRIRILLLLHELSLTGAPRAALDVFEGTQEDYSLRVLSGVGGPLLGRCQTLGPVQILRNLPPRRLRITRQVRRVIRRFWIESLRRWKPDVIYANSIASLPIVSEFGLDFAPILLHVHELHSAIAHYTRENPELPATLRERPERYIACSEAVRAFLIDEYGVPADKVTTIHSFALSRKFERDDKASGLEPTKDKPFVVGGAGTVEWRKGDSQWLQMAAELKYLLGEDHVRFIWVPP